ncbi:hypothetical protein K7432_014193 [Basidiobolus ranarum]|uniref:Velvet domain-containing protein n=1 Tax=Basidiobolus ranarum TaxID=34480 RepID=A0ABR2WHZ5_9FUNG
MPQDHQFLNIDHFAALQNNTGFELIVRQQPDRAQIGTNKDKIGDRSVDPPPIVQIKQKEASEQAFSNMLQSPCFFMMAEVIGPTDVQQAIPPHAFSGTLASSLHKLKDIDNNDGGFFIFPEISVRLEGSFRLRFKLYHIYQQQSHFITSLCSDLFTVYSSKTFPGIRESTFLSRSFSDQGARIRVKKSGKASKRKGSTLVISAYPGTSSRQRRNSQMNMMEDSSPHKTFRSSSLELSSDYEENTLIGRRTSYLIASHLSAGNMISDGKDPETHFPRTHAGTFSGSDMTSPAFVEYGLSKASTNLVSYSECSTNHLYPSHIPNAPHLQGDNSQVQKTSISLPSINANSSEYHETSDLPDQEKSEHSSPRSSIPDLFPNTFITYLHQSNIPLSSENGRTHSQRR